jgi:hypothetical protein
MKDSKKEMIVTNVAIASAVAAKLAGFGDPLWLAGAAAVGGLAATQYKPKKVAKELPKEFVDYSRTIAGAGLGFLLGPYVGLQPHFAVLAGAAAGYGIAQAMDAKTD